MYDVAKKQLVNGKLILYCINDKKEKQLLNDLSKTVNSATDNQQNKEGKSNLKFNSQDLMTDLPVLETARSLCDYTPAAYCFDASNICTVYKEVLTPPPNNDLSL